MNKLESLDGKIWKFIDGSKSIYHEDSKSFNWSGIIANEVRNMANKALREQGITIDSHGVEFVDKCLFQYLDASVKAVKNVYS